MTPNIPIIKIIGPDKIDKNKGKINKFTTIKFKKDTYNKNNKFEINENNNEIGSMVMPDIDEIYYEEKIQDGNNEKTGHFVNKFNDFDRN